MTTRAGLLWPAIAYRVLVSESRATNLNPVQTAVLELYRLDIRDPDLLASNLHLDRALIVRVLRGLKTTGALSAPTSNPAAVVADPALRYVFQSPYTGELWPNIAKGLDRPIDEWRTDNALVLAGERVANLWTVPIPEDLPSPPTPEEVSRAVNRAVARDDGDQRIVHVDHHPIAVHLVCLVELPTEANDRDGWYALEPFTGEGSAFLRRDLERGRGASDVTADLLRQFENLESSRELGPHRRYLEGMEDQCRADLEARIGRDNLSRLGDSYALLIGVERDRRSAEVDPVRARLLRSHVATDAQKVLEHAVGMLLEAAPMDPSKLAELKRLVNKTKGRSHDFSKALLAAWPAEFPPIPQKLADQRDGELDAAFRKRASLRGITAAVVASAIGRPEHPLAAILAAEPGWLDMIDSVADIRNRGGAHYGDDLSAEDVDQVSGATIRILAALLPHLPVLGKESVRGETA